MTQTIVITSGKGGVGKTNISVNMAIELARRDFRTCLFDADLGLANVNILLGIDPEYTLDDYIFGDKSLDEIILQTKFGIDVIPGSSGIEKMANLEREEITNLVAAFSQIKGYDFFLIDTSSGISRGVISFCLASSETIIVITSEATSLTDAYAVLKVMALNNYPGTVKILVNKRPSIPQAKQTFLRFKEVVNRHLEIDIAPAGIILNDPNIEISVTKQEPALILFPDTVASQCIRAVVSNLIMDGSKNPEEEDFGEFWQRYFEHSLLDTTDTTDTSLPNKPVDKNISDSYYQPEDHEENISTSTPLILQPVAAPPVLPISQDTSPIASSIDQKDAATDHKSRDIILENIAPFIQYDGIFEVSDLPSPTPLLSKSLELLARDEITEEILLDIFSCDPILMVKALKMICRPKTDTRRATRITTKHQLIEELGTVVLTNILSTTAMQRALRSEVTYDHTCSLASSFWSHSYKTALLAQNIAEITGYLFPEEAFIAGLIHDIGRLALQTDHPEVYTQSCYEFGHDETLETEQRIFKNNHAEIGANALRAWHLDSFLVDAVQYHTEPLCKIETAFSLVKILSLACRLSHLQKCREKEDETAQLGMALFNLSASQLKDLVANADQKTQQLAERFHIETNTLEKTETHFRQQVMEYSLLQGMLPCTPSDGEISEVIKSIFGAFDVLFNFRPSFCLMPDDQQSILKAIEYPTCFGRELLADIQFSLKWQQSLVVESFHSGELKSAVEGDNGNELPIADHQLLRSLGTEGFVCLPMIAHKISRGIIVFGIKRTELANISSLQNRLEQFAVQAARKFDN